MKNVDAQHGDDLEPYYSFATIAASLDISERTVRRWADSGVLVAHRVGGRRRVARSDLENFLAAGREG